MCFINASAALGVRTHPLSPPLCYRKEGEIVVRIVILTTAFKAPSLTKHNTLGLKQVRGVLLERGWGGESSFFAKEK
jgi:hypothetical protein